MIGDKRIIILLMSFLLSGCSTFMSSTYRQADGDIDDNIKKAERLAIKAKQPMNKADTSVVPVKNRAYIGATVLKRDLGQRLPVAVERNGIRLKSAVPLDLLAIGELVSEATNIPVSFATDIQKLASETSPLAPSSGNSTPQSDSDENAKLAAALDASLAKAQGSKSVRPINIGNTRTLGFNSMRVNYQGPLSGFLNQVAGYFDIGWRYEDGRIIFSHQVTRTFTLAIMPGTMDGSASMTAGISDSTDSSGGSGEGSSGVTAGATQTSTVSVKLDVWKEVEKSIKGIIGEQGTYAVSPSSGTVTVTGSVSMVDRAARQIYELNKRLLRQVTMKVEVYNVALTKDSNWQFNLDGVLNSGIGTFSIGNAIDPVLGNNGGISAGVVDGRFKGSQAVLSLLEQKGDVSVVNSASLTTMSGQPVPVQVSNTQNYVESVTQSSDEGVTTITPNIGSVNSGFSLSVLPKVMDDGKVLLQYTMNISTLVGPNNGFNTYKYGENSVISLPNLDQRSFIQSGLINNGSTLVLAGYEKLTNSTSDDGQGSASFKGLGGSRTGKQQREILVVMITPIVLDHSAELAMLN